VNYGQLENRELKCIFNKYSPRLLCFVRACSRALLSSLVECLTSAFTMQTHEKNSTMLVLLFKNSNRFRFCSNIVCNGR